MEAKIASDANLTLLFGNKGYVSSQLWELQKSKVDTDVERNKMNICRFVKRYWTWEWGCTIYKPQYRLKLQYLYRDERRERFWASSDNIRDRRFNMKPSLEEFFDSFGSDCLSIWYDSSSSRNVRDEENGTKRKRLRPLNEFSSMQSACNHFFGTDFLDEALHDVVGSRYPQGSRPEWGPKDYATIGLEGFLATVKSWTYICSGRTKNCACT